MRKRPSDFWCNECQKWTPVKNYPDGFGCSRCGEHYLCDECGYEIDRSGECQRPEGHSSEYQRVW